MTSMNRIVVSTAGLVLCLWGLSTGADLLTELQHLREYSTKCIERQKNRIDTRPTDRPETADVGSLAEDEVVMLIQKTARRYSIDPALVLAVARVESGLDHSAISPKGAVGVMQIMPVTARELDVDRNNITENIDGGVRYLRQMIEEFGLRKGLAAYNFGPENIRAGKRWPTETRIYVQKVLSLYRG